MKRKHRREKLSETGRWVFSDVGREAIKKLERDRRIKRALSKKKIKS